MVVSEIKDILLDIKNPRHETDSQENAIKWLCDNEKIYELAKDIAKN